MITDKLQKSTPTWKYAACSPATTLAIWSPRSSARIVLTGLNISATGATTGTVSVFFSTSTATRGKQVAVYAITNSTFINPLFNGLDGGVDVPLNVMSNTVGVEVMAFGFEL